MSMLWQLAPDVETYGKVAGWWLVVSDDGEVELAGPFPTEAEASTACTDIDRGRA